MVAPLFFLGASSKREYFSLQLPRGILFLESLGLFTGQMARFAAQMQGLQLQLAKPPSQIRVQQASLTCRLQVQEVALNLLNEDRSSIT